MAYELMLIEQHTDERDFGVDAHVRKLSHEAQRLEEDLAKLEEDCSAAMSTLEADPSLTFMFKAIENIAYDKQKLETELRELLRQKHIEQTGEDPQQQQQNQGKGQTETLRQRTSELDEARAALATKMFRKLSKLTHPDSPKSDEFSRQFFSDIFLARIRGDIEALTHIEQILKEHFGESSKYRRREAVEKRKAELETKVSRLRAQLIDRGQTVGAQMHQLIKSGQREQAILTLKQGLHHQSNLLNLQIQELRAQIHSIKNPPRPSVVTVFFQTSSGTTSTSWY